MEDQLIMTALFQQNAKVIEQNPSITLTINNKILSSRLSEHACLQNISLWPYYFSVYWFTRGTALGIVPLCYLFKLILE